MIRDVFCAMDADQDGLLSASDIRAYFRTIGRSASDLEVRKWILARDVDQDGAVSLIEFVASYALQLDSNKPGPSDADTAPSTIAVAFGSLRLGSTAQETLVACDAIEGYITRILDSPNTSAYWSIAVNEGTFHRNVGRLFGGIKLMTAFGFALESNGTVLALKGKGWDSVPQAIRVELNRKLEELRSHRNALSEPSISNIAAGNENVSFISFDVINSTMFIVSVAIGNLGDGDSDKANSWLTALETILLIISNVLKLPVDPRYFTINVMNPKFHEKVGRVQGAVDILTALGFQESEGGTLQLPLTANLKHMAARQLEIKTGIDMIRSKIDKMKQVTEDSKKSEAESKTKGKSDSKPDAKATTNNTAKSAKVATEAAPQPKKRQPGAAELAEKEKLRRVEAALLQKTAALNDVQAQLFELKENEFRNLNLKYALTADRMPPSDQHRVAEQLASVGKTMDATSSNKKGATTTVVAAKKASADSFVRTSMVAAARAGESRIQVASQEGFKKGMAVLVGSGTKAECLTIAGFGSILLSQPLMHQHSVGTSVVACQPNAKNMERLQRLLHSEFARGLLVEEIIPHSVQIAEQNLLALELNKLYAARPVLKDVVSVVVCPEVDLGLGACDSLSVSSQLGCVVTSRGGALNNIGLSFSPVELVLLFEYTKASSSDADSREGEDSDFILQSELLQQVTSDTVLSGVFQQLVDVHGAQSLEKMVTSFARAEGNLFWSDYLNLVSVVSRPSVPSTGKKSTAKNALEKIFDMCDYDGDECLTFSETSDVFSQLDGAVKRDVLSKVVAEVVGGAEEDAKLSLQTFLSVRSQYATQCGTLDGGMCLSGKLGMMQTVAAALHSGEIISDGPVTYSSLLAVQLPPNIGTALWTSGRYLHKVVLASGITLEELLETTSPLTIDRLLSQHASLCGRPVVNQSFGGVVSGEVIGTWLDNSQQLLYTLASNGTANVFDLQSHKVLVHQRVMWAQPPPARSIEGYDKFMAWRKLCGLDASDSRQNSVDSRLNFVETTRMSALLSKFSLSLPGEAHQISRAMAVDGSTGLIAVNCSIVSGSICFFEPLSLRFLYRIRSPWKCSTELSNAISGLSLGRVTDSQAIQSQHCHGVVCDMQLLATRSVMVCRLLGGSAISVVSLMSGDVLTELAGHCEPISHLTFCRSVGSLFSGSHDSSVRVWLINDCIPSQSDIKLSIGPADSATARLENVIANALSSNTGNVAAGSMKVLRKLFTHLSARLHVTSRWRRGRITGFVSDKQYSSVPRHSSTSQPLSECVEVTMENAAVVLISNFMSIRHAYEMDRAPSGPPCWSDPAAELDLGREVAVYEVDPDELGLFCARAFGTQLTSHLSFGEIMRRLGELVGGDGLSAAEITLSLEVMGFVSTDLISVQTLIRRLGKMQSKHISSCDRCLYGNVAAISAIQFCEASKLLVALDRSGRVCVWDPCATRTSLSLQSHSQVPVSLGAFPYHLVASVNIATRHHFTSHTSSSIQTLDLTSRDRKVSFPVSAASLLDALRLDDSSAGTDTQPSQTIKALVYVLKDGSHLAIQTSCFLTALVTLDSEQHFLSSPTFVEKFAAQVPTLQQIFVRRNEVVRVVFSVSQAHSHVEELVSDLDKYGVLHRGFTSTPSDMVQVVCFERSIHKQLDSSVIRPLIGTSAAKHNVGMIVECLQTQNQTRGAPLYRVAVFLSSDVMLVDETRIVRMIRQSGIGTLGSSSGGYVVGAVVEFVREDSKLKPSTSNTEDELLLVSLSGVDELGDVRSSLVPVMIGRTSAPVPALQISQSVSENTKRVSTQCLVNSMGAALGRFGVLVGSKAAIHSSWNRTLTLHHTQAVYRLLQPKDIVGDTAAHLTVSSLVPINVPQLHFAFSLLLLLPSFMSNPHHPLSLYAQSLFGQSGLKIRDEVSKGVQRDQESFLNSFLAQWLMRTRVTAEELATTCTRWGGDQLDNIYSIAELSLTLNTANPLSSSALPLGTICVEDIQLMSLTSTTRNSNSSSQSADLLDVSAMRRNNDILSLLLSNHQVAELEKGVAADCSRIEEQANAVLLSLLHTNTASSLTAVRSSGKSDTVTKQGYPVRAAKTEGGQFNVVSSGSSVASNCSGGLRIPQLVTSVLSACRMVSGVPRSTQDTFMVWRFAARDTDVEADQLELMSSYAKSVAAVQRQAPVVRLIDGVRFSGDVESSCAVCEWQPQWKSLSDVLPPSGLLSRDLLDLFRLYAANLLDGLMAVHESGLALRTLNPTNIIVDETGLNLLLLLLPSVLEVTAERPALQRSSKFVREYAEISSPQSVIAACLSPEARSGIQTSCDTTQEDVWSFGVTVFTLAFGVSPAQFIGAMSASADDQSASPEARVISQLLRPLNQSNADTASSVEGFLRSLMSEGQKSVLFSLVRHYTGQSMDKLAGFRNLFCAEADSCGLTSRAIGELWDRLVQRIFVSVSGGKSDISALQNAINSRSVQLNEVAGQQLVAQLFGLTLTQKEFVAFVTGLIAQSSRDVPFMQRMREALLALGSMLEDIHSYGVFLQVLSLVCSCLAVVPVERPSLKDLRAMALFSFSRESLSVKAGRDAMVLVCPSKDPTEFSNEHFLRPLNRCLQWLLDSSDGQEVARARDVHSYVSEFSSVLGEFESAVSCFSDVCAGRPSTKYSSLSTDTEWLEGNLATVIKHTVGKGFLSLTALFCLRFVDSGVSKYTDHVSGASTKAVSLSLGSKMIARTTKLYQQLVHSLAAVSRHLNMTALSSLPSSESPEPSILRRVAADDLYRSTLISLLMLMLGQESLTGVDSMTLSKQLVTESHWSSGTCKLFEPLLIDLVGEDGGGTTKVQISGEVLRTLEGSVNLCRGSVYFVSLIRLVRGLYALETSSDKALERAQQSVVSAVTLLLPNLTATGFHAMTAADAQAKTATAPQSAVQSFVPDSGCRQKLLVLLDLQCSSRLQVFLGGTDIVAKLQLLSLLQRVFSLCLAVSDEVSEPFASLGRQFSSAGWVKEVADILASKVVHGELSGSAALCARLMAQRALWMRCWAPFNLLPSLFNVSQLSGTPNAVLRAEAQLALKHVNIHAPVSIRSLVALRLPKIAGTEAMLSGVESPINLLIEANDISFGSTLGEQARFADVLVEWFGAAMPSADSAKSFSNEWSEHLFELAQLLSGSWVPQFCLSLMLTDSKDASKRDKLQLSADVAIKHLKCLEKILFHALDHPLGMSLIVSCFSAPKNALTNSNAGLFATMSLLTSSGSYVDLILSLSLQMQIVEIICKVVRRASKELLHILCSCGLVACLLSFLQSSFALVRDVNKLGLLTAFGKEQRRLSLAAREMWSVLVTAQDDKVVEDLVALGVLRRLVDEWLPSTISVSLVGADSEYNALVVRSEAVRMLQVLVSNQHLPHCDRLVAELVRCMTSVRTVEREMGVLTAPNVKKGAANTKKLAAEALSAIAAISAEGVEQELLVSVLFSPLPIYNVNLLFVDITGIWSDQDFDVTERALPALSRYCACSVGQVGRRRGPQTGGVESYRGGASGSCGDGERQTIFEVHSYCHSKHTEEAGADAREAQQRASGSAHFTSDTENDW